MRRRVRIVTIWPAAKKQATKKVKPSPYRLAEVALPSREVRQSDSGTGSHAETKLVVWQGGHMGSQSKT